MSLLSSSILILFVLLHDTLCGQTVLNISMLNSGETVSLSLSSYLNASKQATIDRVHSSKNIQSLALQLTTNQPLLNVASLLLQVVLPNGTQYDFNAEDVLESCSLYNQPNKLFLMRGNIILSVRYQFSPSDAAFSVAVAVVQGGEECTELNVMQSYGKYYAVVGCLRSENQSVLHAFRFDSTNPSTVNGFIPLNSLTLPMVSCTRLETYSFIDFTIQTKTYYNSVLFYCAEGMKPNEPSNLYFASIESRKGEDRLVFLQPTYSLPARELRRCLAGSKWVGRYQQGILIEQEGKLSYFHGQLCDDVMLDVSGAQFVEGVQEEEVQYIYVMFADRMYIKQSYSPNFQTVPLGKKNNLTLHSYAIAKRFLALLFDNSTHQALIIYDLVRAYPTEIDQITWAKTKAQMTAYPVSNFLDSGNYFLTFDQLTGQLVLNYYQGYMLTFSVGDPLHALPHVTVNISDQFNQNLVLECHIRDFNDASIVESPLSKNLKTYHDILVVNLSDYVYGPFGRFYNYPNNISAFQYINEFSEVDLSSLLKANHRPLAISFNNYLDAAVINFYYASLAKTCELDFEDETRTVSLADCKTLTRKKGLLQSPQEIVVLSEDKYLEYNQTVLQYCALSSNNEFECLSVASITVGIGGFGKVKLVRYFYTKDTDEVIELIVYNSAEVLFCCLQRNVYSKAQFNYTLHFHATTSNLPDLANFSIRNLLFDPGYTQFMALHLANDSAHRVVVFSKPAFVKNSSSFIGQVMRRIQFIQLQSVFAINNLLVCVFPEEKAWVIQEYKVTKYFRVKETRKYPLYHLTLSAGGTHAQDGNYIYIQAIENSDKVYAVYSPLRSSFGVLIYKFPKQGDSPIIFAQQLGEVSNNSMGLNGGKLFGLVAPELTFKFLGSSAELVQMGNYEFKVGVVDSSNKMTLLSYEFPYNQGEESIRYDGDMQVDLRFDDSNHYAQFQINPEKVHGPVNSYQLQLPTDNSCGFFTVKALDVFTKEGCLAYSNPGQFGVLTDFLALQLNGIALELIVTQLSLMCVVDRRMSRMGDVPRLDLNGLANCKLEQSQLDIFMVCDNAASFGKLLFRVAVGIGGLLCTVGLDEVAMPSWFGYVDYAVKTRGEWLVLEVPIRYRQNCIYFKTSIVNGIINPDSHSLLVGNSSAFSQFQARDTSIGPELFFILDSGVGIYNLSDTAKEIKPALWLSQAEISTASLDDGPLAYLKFISLSSLPSSLSSLPSGEMSITVEVGTEQSAFEVVIEVMLQETNQTGQTSYSKKGVRVVYQYRQYTSCRNNVQSKSQNFGSLTIKLCSYEPPDELVFANFVSISNDTPRTLIQFYNRSGFSSYPFRTDTIYSNTLSHHTFLIREDTLIVASLFNMLCYYALAYSLRWQFSYLNASSLAEPDKPRTDKQCAGKLVISNLQFRKELQVQVSYDAGEDVEDYWSNGTFYIQRVLLLLLMANGIRLLWNARGKRTRKLTKRFSTRVHTNRFEVMVKINSKKNT